MPRIVAPFTLTPRPRADEPDAGSDPVLALTTFDKVFAGGGITGSSVVRMVSAGVAGAPLVYVALERVQGELDGRSGAFVLRHVGTVTTQGASLGLEVVDGSGTEDLAGITGTGSIEHTDDGVHLELDYTLPG